MLILTDKWLFTDKKTDNNAGIPQKCIEERRFHGRKGNDKESVTG